MSELPASISRIPQGRKAVISREELIAAAFSLLGPDRSVSTLSLREVARAAGIAPNSFYRHFRDIDELAIAVIEQAGSSLRRLLNEARQRASTERSVVRSSLEVFLEQLNAETGYLDLLLREGKIGSAAFKATVERQLVYFEDELQTDLVRLEQGRGYQLHEPALVARAITRLVFAMGAMAASLAPGEQAVVLEQTAVMLQMILVGSRSMAKTTTDAAVHTR